ncbi:unnamed protein product [Tilletia controversa]|nr:unnamed protein product [Tilletia controversa]
MHVLRPPLKGRNKREHIINHDIIAQLKIIVLLRNLREPNAPMVEDDCRAGLSKGGCKGVPHGHVAAEAHDEDEWGRAVRFGEVVFAVELVGDLCAVSGAVLAIDHHCCGDVEEEIGTWITSSSRSTPSQKEGGAFPPSPKMGMCSEGFTYRAAGHRMS